MKRFFALATSGALIGALVGLALPSPASAWDLQAVPSVFVGLNNGDCFPGSVPGSNIVTSAWFGGLGLPDNGGGNTTILNPVPDTRDDLHHGIILSKNGPTSDCSSADVDITGVEGMVVNAGFVLGFDFRNGGHCGGGAPRFNVDWTDPLGVDQFSFIGNCNSAVQTPANQDPTEWTTVTWQVTGACQPGCQGPITVGSKIKAIQITFDEGTDAAQAGTQDPRSVGMTTIDNININTNIIRKGPPDP